MNKLYYINQLVESNEVKSNRLAEQIVLDLHHLTTYQAPQAITFNVSQLSDAIHALSDHVEKQKHEGTEEDK